MSNLLGQQIGRYQLLDVIGQGGMGIVYRATDASMARDVAIKMLHGAYAQDKDLLARFYREARSTASLQHKNIVTVFALDEFEGFPYMVMEYLEGQSMAEMITSRRQNPLVDKIGLVCQVCEGLQYAHERNPPVIHRDIKPANILILKDGTAKIVDFGIARAGMSDTLTQTGQVIGSIYYMSPEQISGAPLDPRTDIYSAGVMLFQFLAGELPFKDSEGDSQSTLVKILNEPVPSLSKYLADYPPVLNEIIAKAMAKNVEERYQTAEDLGYDLSRLQESLKRGMTAEFLAKAKTAISQKDWEIARQQLQEVLRYDRRNPEANELFQVVREEFQRQQRSVQIAQLRSQAQMALDGQQYEEALECVEQARRLDPEDPDLTGLSRLVKGQIERARELAEALRLGHAALYAGDLKEAETAVRRALQIDRDHTEARALKNLIEKELAERNRRAQYQGLLEEARREISSRNFLPALHALLKAKEIDPTDSNIRELINWAARGHEQEKLRKELEECTNKVGQLLGEDRYEEALNACQAGLQRFSEDPSLLKLQQLAKRQCDLIARRRAIDEASAAARELAAADRNDEAIELLVAALGSFPGDPYLETLLAITRAEAERKLQEQQERERYQRIEPLEEGSADTATIERQNNLDRLNALQQGLARKLPLSQLRSLAGAVSNVKLDASEAARYSSALAEVEVRSRQWAASCAELNRLSDTMPRAKDNAEVDSLLSRALAIAEQHVKDDEIRGRYTRLRQTAEEWKRAREAASKEISDLLRSVQASQSLVTVSSLSGRIQELSQQWLGDEFIRGLASQASAHLEDLSQRKQSILLELGQLAESISNARSGGQIRLLVEQAKMLTADFDDSDITRDAGQLHELAEGRLERLEQKIAQLREIASAATSARTLDELERCGAHARSLVSDGSDTEEANDLLRRIEHIVAERNKEYRRIGSNLERLVESSGQATGPAELDLILARRRDLLKKFAGDTYFSELETRLDAAVSERRAYLAAEAALAEAVAAEAEAAAVATEIGHAADVAAIAAPTVKSETPSSAVIVSHIAISYPVEPRARTLRAGAVVASVGALAAVVAIAIFWGSSRNVTLRTDPPGAQVTVDRQTCESPCVAKLKAGEHEVSASLEGYESLHKSFTVARFGGEVPVFTMSPSPVVVGGSGGLGGSGSGGLGSSGSVTGALHGGTLTVDAGAPDVSVFVDGRLEGRTSGKGQLNIAATEGAHQLRLERSGYKSTEQAVKLGVNENVLVHLNLEAVPPPPPGQPSGSLAASAASITLGQPVTLTWHTENATDVSINGLGQVPGDGSKQLNPDRPATYTLTAKGPSGMASYSVSVDVVAPQPKIPAPVGSFKVSPESVTAGQPVTLTWHTENATSVTIEGLGTVPLSGSQQVSPDRSMTYKLAASGPSGNFSGSAYVDVHDKPPPPKAVDLDREGIQGALNSYQEAYESESPDAMKKAWPTISKAEQSNMKVEFANFNAIRVKLSCPDEDIRVMGGDASAECVLAFTYTKGGHPLPAEHHATHIGLHKEAGKWTIASIKGH